MLFKNTPIRRKLTLIIMLTTSVALLLTCGSFFVYELITFRQSAVQQLSAQGEIIAANSTAALAFDNQSDAQEVLDALKAEHRIAVAALYDKQGRLYSKYPATLPDTAFPPKPAADGYRFLQSNLVGFQPVVQGSGDRLGTLYLKTDGEAISQRFRLYTLITSLVMVLSLLVAYMISRVLERRISQPILSLAGIAEAVSDHGDYSVRATKLSGDELGLLTDAFNQMLGRIQEQNQELKQGEERLRAVLDSATCAVIVSEPDGTINDWNSRAEKMFGWPQEQALGRQLLETVVTAGCSEPLQQTVERILANGKAPNQFVDITAHRKDGSEFPAEISFSLLHIGGHNTVCSFINDLTERKQAEATQRKNFELEEMNHRIMEANRMKSEFLTNMSHELRTPLNGIIGFSEFLVDGKPGPLNEKQRDYLGDILNSGRHLLHLINDVLDIAKVEAGRMDFHPETFSLVRAVEEVRAVTKPLAEKRNVSLTASIDPGLDLTTLDQQRFKQVLYNLLSNGIKFTDPGGKVELTAASVGEDRFTISVNDSGIGIKPEDMKRLFREFEQLESGVARRYEGTGLGLALTRKIVELQGGSIKVESKVGEGSTFTVELPLHAEGENYEDIANSCRGRQPDQSQVDGRRAAS